MPLTPNEQPITNQLLSAISDMRDFLLDNPMATNFSDVEKYKNLYIQISKLGIKTLAERYVGYKHSNPHKTLAEFLNTRETSKQILKYYSEPVFKKDIIPKNIILKGINSTLNRVGKFARIINTFRK